MLRSCVMGILALLLLPSLLCAAGLRSPNNQADYLIITHKRLECAALHSFELHRLADGLNIRTVYVDDIYAEFNDTSSSASIRQFLSYVLTQWQKPSLRYVLLAGGVQFVPSNVVESEFKDYPNANEKVVSLDMLYAVNRDGGDEIPDIALGRLPASSVQELTIMLTKTMEYEKNIRQSDFSVDFLGIADKENDNDDVFGNLIHSSYLSSFSAQRSRVITLYDPSPNYGTRNDILAAVRANPKYLLYAGHSNQRQWSRSELLLAEDIEKDINNTLPFLYIDATGIQRFDDTLRQGMTEKFLIKSKGGAVACIASAGIMYLSPGILFSVDYVRIHAQTPELRLGEAFLRAQKSNLLRSGKLHTLLGDPALKIPVDKPAGIPSLDSTALLLRCVPSVAQNHIVFSCSMNTSDRARLAIYDYLGREVALIKEGVFETGEHTFSFDTSQLNEGMYFCRLSGERHNSLVTFVILR